MTIIIAFIVTFHRGTPDRAPVNYMMVFLFKEITQISQKTSLTLPAPAQGKRIKINNHEIISSPEAPLNDISIRESAITAKSENTKESSEIEANNHEPVSSVTEKLQSYSIHWNNNITSPSLDKARYDSIPNGTAGLSEQNIHAQNTDTLYAMIRTAIEKAKKYPFLARKRKIEGIVFMAFIIDRKGYPQDIKIEKSSGYEILDSAAIKTVKNAAPLTYVKGEIIIPIRFKLTDSQTY